MPVDAGKIFGDKPFLHEPAPISVQDIQFPSDDPVVAETLGYAKDRLHAQTFNHSMRVFYYGRAITRQQFPQKASSFSPVTWVLTCLLHDIGTAEENLTTTHMSFDIYGGIKALDALKNHGATTDQAEAVCEAIIRHQDMGVDGGHLNVKDFDKMVHDKTRREINEAHPRLGWCSFFAGTIRKEEEIKPWCHSTHIVGFDREIESNTLMKEWE
ncbi:Cyanamide hydratase [Colletotrichum fructicola]|nr:Cyanamide hydratase [Colletotrichum fructicola]KAF4916195.1 Cyanamide hydratase [Colletotrichum fructicola]KAF4941830.1 Cyanamide hydratase [Colletotrichum fructicola]